ncbi:MAG: acyl-CoA reductase [Saprospiraceae bacterium]
MLLSKKIEILSTLGDKLQEMDLSPVIQKAYSQNPWFTPENIQLSFQSIITQFLQREKLTKWVQSYPISNQQHVHKIGMVLAGNIPMVGFHDILCTFITNNVSVIKYSSKDDILIPFIIELLNNLDAKTKPYFERVERLSGMDAIIATGSNNSAQHFSYYFKNYPYIIRKNRNGIAILDGNESVKELTLLGNDIFHYFGLGCRSISKLYLPAEYNIPSLLSTFDPWSELTFHHKYKNNLDYNHALFLLNKQEFLHHDALLLLESHNIASRIGCVHYEYYENQASLEEKLSLVNEEIQCIVSNTQNYTKFPLTPFGQTQFPAVDTYADGVDTLSFLLQINSN